MLGLRAGANNLSRDPRGGRGVEGAGGEQREQRLMADDPRSAETVLKLFIGDLVLQFAAVQAAVEALTARVRELEGRGDGRPDDATE